MDTPTYTTETSVSIVRLQRADSGGSNDDDGVVVGGGGERGVSSLKFVVKKT